MRKFRGKGIVKRFRKRNVKGKMVLILNGLKNNIKSLNISSLKTCFIVLYPTTPKHFRYNLSPLEKKTQNNTKL